jgi:hemin uptake protein HemP
MDSALMKKRAETGEAGQVEAEVSRSIALAGNRLESRDLFVGTREITIGHEGEVYRLRLTALNKLILTK